MILLSYLLGSDYSDGVKGVGPMGAMEILVACQPPPQSENANEEESAEDSSKKQSIPNEKLLEPLVTFEKWMKGDGKQKLEVQFDSLLQLKKKKATLEKNFPNPKIFDYYANPKGDDSTEPFSWGDPNLPLISEFTDKYLQWSKEKTAQTLNPILERYRSTSKASLLSYFFPANSVWTSVNRTSPRSKRLKRVIQLLKRRTDKTIVIDEGSESQEETPTKPKRKARGKAKKKKNRKLRQNSFGELVEGSEEESSSEAELESRVVTRKTRSQKNEVIKPDGDVAIVLSVESELEGELDFIATEKIDPLPKPKKKSKKPQAKNKARKRKIASPDNSKVKK